MDTAISQIIQHLLDKLTLPSLVVALILFLFTLIVCNGDKISILLETMHKLFKKGP